MIKSVLNLSACLLVPSALFGQLYQIDGQDMNDRFGGSVSAAGDVNGDGFDDVIVGASGANIASGSAYAYSGLDGSLIYQWDGQFPLDRFGWSVSTAGDVNGDGYDDIIIGAPDTDFNGSASGSAYVYSGLNRSLIYQWDGKLADDRFGGSVSTAGDIDGDGFADLIVGAAGTDINGSNSGSAYAYSGLDGSLIYQWDGQLTDDHLGGSVSTAGDVDGDGFADLIVGATATDINGSNSGSAYVYSGATGLPLYQFNGQNSVSRFGYCVSAAGDVNGDGYDDIIIGAWSADDNVLNSGSAYVYSGDTGLLLHLFSGQSTNDRFGYSVSGAGDVNGDGLDDLIVGANGASNGFGSGSAYVYSGAPNGSLIYQFDGRNASDHFGGSVSAVGDVNGDGYDDIIIGADSSDASFFDSGSAYIYSLYAKYSITPMTAGSPATLSITGAAPSSTVTLGFSLAGPGPSSTAYGIVDMTLPITALTALTTDANGNASSVKIVPWGFMGATVYTQGYNNGLLTNSLAEFIN
jgi:hypothetical protein